MSPSYFDAQPETSQANQLFLWFIEEGGELGVVHEEKKAQELCAFCNSQSAIGSYELVEVTEDDDLPILGGKLLGFDISQGFNNSLLWSGLKTNVPSDAELPVRILANALFRLFSEKLNECGLFPDIEIARQCRRSMIALQNLEPNFIEGDGLEKFLVVGIYLV